MGQVERARAEWGTRGGDLALPPAHAFLASGRGDEFKMTIQYLDLLCRKM